MGLYLCVFDDAENEVDGVEVGSYDDYESLIDAVVEHLEDGDRGSRFPTLCLHHDSDGVWKPEECEVLRQELEVIGERLRQLPPRGFKSTWQQEVAGQIGLVPKSLFECFIDVDGEFLVDRLMALCDVAIERSEPIRFQ